jgi:Zn finger protein HypA/HybF involved in hydrogenase expression
MCQQQTTEEATMWCERCGQVDNGQLIIRYFDMAENKVQLLCPDCLGESMKKAKGGQG